MSSVEAGVGGQMTEDLSLQVRRGIKVSRAEAASVRNPELGEEGANFYVLVLSRD